MQNIIALFKFFDLIDQKIVVEGVILKKSDDSLLPFYEFAVNHAAIGIHAIDQKGHTVIYNDKMKEIEGLAFEDVGDRSILELFNFDQEESTLLKVLQSGKEQVNVKQTYWNRNGTEITTINDTYPICMPIYLSEQWKLPGMSPRLKSSSIILSGKTAIL